MNCQICREEKKLLEHHILYADRTPSVVGGEEIRNDFMKIEHLALTPTEIIIKICMDCHSKIHEGNRIRETGADFHQELNPVYPSKDWINFLVELDESFDIKWGFGQHVKYELARTKSGNCQTIKSNGDVCGRELPCRYHGEYSWQLIGTE